jgi:hypothetical protein
MYGGYRGYDFRGLQKRTRRALKEADDVASTRIARVIARVNVPSARGGGDAAGANRVEFGDVINAAPRGEAAAPKAEAEENIIDDAAKDDDDDGDLDDGDASTTTKTTTTTHAALKYVKRADGGGLGGAPVALEVFNEPLCAAIVNNETVRGVDFEKIIHEIYSRVSPSACTRDEFVSWLVRGAPMFAAATGVPNVDMSDVTMADECNSEFRRRESSLAVWSSPLNAAESSFAWSSPLNAVRVAAKALDASDDATREALEEAETAKGVSLRYLRTRGCYHYRVLTNDGLVFAYVGESVDVERRINDHVTALIGDAHVDTIQRGHKLVRDAAAARKGDHDDDHDNDDVSSFDFKAWVVHGHDQASAVELCETYVKTCAASPRQPRQPSILEVARAIAGAGFFQEAVWTAHYGTLHGHTASEGVIGMNFSQPGVCHPSQGDGVDSDDIMSWEAMKALKSGKKKTTTTSGSHARSEETQNPAFTCSVCDRELVQGKGIYRQREGDGRVCSACYQRKRRAKQPACTCAVCDKEVAQGKRSYARGEGGGRMCNACYQRALQAKQYAFVCSVCDREFGPGKQSYPRREGSGRMCVTCYNASYR